MIAEAAFPAGERYLHNPSGWAKDRSGTPLWSKQVEVLESVRDNHDTAVHSCHNIGKSFSAALAACWWLDSHPPGTAFVVTTAPTGPQVKAILWREIGRCHKRAGLAGRTNLTEWYIGGELVAFGRKPSEHEPTAFQGIHAPFVLVIYDEACGIPEALWNAGSTLTSNDTSRQLAIGNPDDPHTKFGKVCQAGSDWNVIHVGAEHTPNFTGEAVTDLARSSLISVGWAETKRKEWGEHSALYISKVKGLFPSDAKDGVIPNSFLSKARLAAPPSYGTERVAGLDVGGGGDRTVLYPRVGNTVLEPHITRLDDPMLSVGWAVDLINTLDLERIVVDVIGIGWGVAGRLRELSSVNNPTGEKTHSADVVSFNAAEASGESAKYANKRAEMWWLGREACRTQAWNLEAVSDDTAAELIEPKYKIVDSNGKIQIEKKEDIIKRLGRSPDLADALLQSFWPHTGQAQSFASSLTDRVFTGVE